MGNRLDLPRDQWAVLRDAVDVTGRQRKPVIAAMEAQRSDGPPADPELVKRALDGDEAAQLELGLATSLISTFAVLDAAVVAFVEAWSFAAEISADGFDDLPIDAQDALRVAVTPLVSELAPNFAPDAKLPEPVDDDGKASVHPFGNSSASSRGSPAVAQ